MTHKEQYLELTYYTLSLQDKHFIHQHVVDAFTAQAAAENTKPIAIIFALAGLYLFLEKNYTGREVHLAHVAMTKNKDYIPVITLPKERGAITVENVLAVQLKDRKTLIHQWCISVWEAYAEQHEIIIATTAILLGK